MICINITEPAFNQFKLTISVSGVELLGERTSRVYASESDAITSARHAVNEYRKSQGIKNYGGKK
ncbi:MAG TPA: hypothetical protein VG347_05105 [Verrucomicrobiae bacterium]|nr:hypothetical protein [Verrucomicrobiae bacterium]